MVLDILSLIGVYLDFGYSLIGGTFSISIDTKILQLYQDGKLLLIGSVWANFALGSNSVKGKARPNILYE